MSLPDAAADELRIQDTLRAFLAEATCRDASQARVLKLKGDASNRSYYRLGDRPSYVAMVMPAGAHRSEEITRGEPPAELPFVNIHRFLTALGARVPAIYRYDAAAGLMLLEDLGDVTLEAALLRDPTRRESLYAKAVDALAALRAAAERTDDPTCLAYSRAFDVELYDWELHHFREYGLEARYGVRLPPADRASLDALFLDIARRLDAEPKGFTHRDYQSRNLMVLGEDLAVIDFQDALLGPRQYDLVALLRDSYVQLERAFIEEMLDRYRARFAEAGGPRLEREPFVQVFDLLTIQRKLKDAGRFEFIARVKGNPGFLPYVKPSLEYVREAFARVPQAAPLQALLARYVPELKS